MYLGDSGGICFLVVGGRGEWCVAVVVELVLYRHLRESERTQQGALEAISGGIVGMCFTVGTARCC